MKYCKKLLSVLLALALCGSMVAPAFATVTFEDLNNAISDDYDLKEEWYKPAGKQEGDRYVYGDKVDDNKYEIEAWDQDDTRYVEVNTNITAADGESSINVGDGKKVDLNLNENTITGNGTDSVFYVAGGDDDPENTPNPGELTIHDGTITNGGGTASQEGPGEGSEDGADGTTPKQGGGIYVGKNAMVTLDNTEVTGNTADQGGGIYLDVGAEAELTNGAEVSGNGGDDVYLAYGDTSVIPDAPSGKNDGASINTPDGGTWTDDSGNSYSGAVKSSEKGLSLTWEPTNTSGSDSSGSDNTSNEVEIDDLDVPLVEGPVSCAEFIHKMWTMDGEPAPLDDRGLPESVDEDHEYAQAIAWAVSAGIVSVETFDPEELLTVALAREFLTSFAAYADMVMPELTTLTGEDKSLVLNSDEVLAEFFDEKDNA